MTIPARSLRAAAVAWTLAVAACAGTTPPAPAPESVGEPPPIPPGEGIAAPAARPLALRSDHPQRYVVVPGDTLWDIAGRFLDSPWRWPEIWRSNPQVGDPDLIYPGDVLVLYYEDGQPRVHKAVRGGRRVIKLSPRIRAQPLDQAVPTIPRDVIQPFLQEVVVLEVGEWQVAPYLLAAEDRRVAFSSGDRVYARGLDIDQRSFRVFRPGTQFRDPETGEFLGQEGVYVADAVVAREGEPATVDLMRSRREALAGDRLLPMDEAVADYHFLPRPAPEDVSGRILSVLSGVSLVGQYQTAVLNLGERDGLQPGHVLETLQAGTSVRDPLAGGDAVVLPDEPSGLIMVYKVHDRISYGLVMSARRPIRLLDRVVSPLRLASPL